MEKLILSCGRYIPQFMGDTETRMRTMEAYLARLSEELEVLLGEMAEAPENLRSAQNSLAAMRNDQGGGV